MGEGTAKTALHLDRRSFGMAWQLGRRIPFLWEIWDALLLVHCLQLISS